MTKKSTILGVIFFELAWWLCVLSGTLNLLTHPFLAHCYLLVLGLNIIYFWLAHVSMKEILLAFILGTLGALGDNLWVYSHFLYFPTHLIFITGLPYWLIMLWFSFSLWFIKTDWLNQSYRNTVIFFIFGGPTAYYGAYKLKALFFAGDFYFIMTFIAFNWFIVGTLFFFGNRFLLSIGKK